MTKANSTPTVGKSVTSTATVAKAISSASVHDGGSGGQPIGGMYVIADTMTLPDGSIVELHYPPNE